MTPIAQSILLLTLSSVVIPTLAWLVVKILNNEKEIIKIQADLAAMNKRCGEHREWLKEVSESLKTLDRTTVAIATKLDVKVERQMK